MTFESSVNETFGEIGGDIADLAAQMAAMEQRLAAIETLPSPFSPGYWKVGLSSAFLLNSLQPTWSDLSNMSLTLTVAAADRFMVIFTSDIYDTLAQTVASVQTQALCRLNVDGVNQPEQHVVSPASLNTNTATPAAGNFYRDIRYGLRLPQTSVWIIDGLAAGSRIFKIQYAHYGTASRLRADIHTRLQILRVPA